MYGQIHFFIMYIYFVLQDGTGSWLYVLDSFFSVCIIGSLVVIVWRGVWSLMDDYLYPDDYHTSAILSLVMYFINEKTYKIISTKSC